jgi:SNF2 family DNA or RNA helicase
MALTTQLLPHQSQAVEWLIQNEKDGAILAYDMGMGKTIITLGLLCSKPMKTLLILPLSLILQWQSEFSKHTKDINSYIYHGTGRVMDFTQNTVITTYNTIVSDYKKRKTEHYRAFDRIVLDEAQYVKNIRSKSHKCLHALFGDTVCKAFLTGTPICNAVDDLIALLILGNKAPFNSISYYKKADLSKLKDCGLILHKERCKEALPALVIRNIDIDLGDAQLMLYQHLKKSDLFILLKIMRMRQAANDIKLIDRDALELCAKMNMIMDILARVPKTEKVVIYSQWIGMLDIAREFIGTANTLIYTGRMKKEEKEGVIRQFNIDNDKKILFITLKAGGCGLNLNIANHAIIIEPYFNDAGEYQAISRLHRIGQEKDVYVHKLQVSNSIEMWLRVLKEYKKKVASSVFNGSEFPSYEFMKIGEMFRELVSS